MVQGGVDICSFVVRRGEKRGRLTPRRHILRTQHHLHRNERDLHPSPGAESREDLIANPMPRAAAHAQRIQQAATDGEDGGAEPHEGRVPAKGGDAAADDDGGDGDADEVGDGADAGPFGRGAFDGLEVKGQVEDVGVEAHGQEAGEGGAGADGTLGEDARGNRGSAVSVK